MNLTDINIPLIFSISFILIIWFESDIMQTLARLTKTQKLFKIFEFEQYKIEEDIMSNYPNFLYTKYTGYLTKLVSCAICLCFWLTLLSLSLIIYKLGYSPIYVILLFPINYVCSLLLYLIIKKLI